MVILLFLDPMLTSYVRLHNAQTCLGNDVTGLPRTHLPVGVSGASGSSFRERESHSLQGRSHVDSSASYLPLFGELTRSVEGKDLGLGGARGSIHITTLFAVGDRLPVFGLVTSSAGALAV